MVRGLFYGVYIYHMPIIHFLIHTQPYASAAAIIAQAVPFTIGIPIASWYYVESPLIRRKRYALSSDTSASNAEIANAPV